jgi:hypothetical protein
MAACATRKRRSYTFMRSIQAFRVALTPMGGLHLLEIRILNVLLDLLADFHQSRRGHALLLRTVRAGADSILMTHTPRKHLILALFWPNQ